MGNDSLCFANVSAPKTRHLKQVARFCYGKEKDGLPRIREW